MTEHIELLEKEIAKLERNLGMAMLRPGVKTEEIRNLTEKIRLKNETVGMLLGLQAYHNMARAIKESRGVEQNDE